MNFFKQMSKKSKKVDHISFYNDVKEQVETERATNEISAIENDHDYLKICYNVQCSRHNV